MSLLQVLDQLLATEANRRTLWIADGKIGIVVETPTVDRLEAWERHQAKRNAVMMRDPRMLEALTGGGEEDQQAKAVRQLKAIQDIEVEALADILNDSKTKAHTLWMLAHIVGIEGWTPTDPAKRDQELQEIGLRVLNSVKLRKEFEAKLTEVSTVSPPLPESSEP